MNILMGVTDLGRNLPKVEASQGTLATVLSTLYIFAGVLAVIFVIVGGIRYILSGGDSSKISQAKSTILYAIIGLIITILAFAITNFVLGNLNVSSFGSLRDSVINTLIYIAGAIAVIMIIFGGFRYVAATGDASKVKAAKDTILYAVIGLIIAILAFAIVNFVIGNI